MTGTSVAPDVSTDPLAEVLHDLGMTRVFHASSHLAAPWGIDVPPLPGTVVFHLVTRGEAVVEVDGRGHRLVPGEVLLAPHGGGHLVLDAPGSPATPLFDLPRVEVGPRHERIHLDGPGPATELVCGAVQLSGLAAARLLHSLPPVVRASPNDDAGRAWLEATFELLAAESRTSRPGGDVVSSRLADILVVHAVRSWLESATPERGWLAALRDPRLGPALSAFHADPSRPWTTEALAAEAAMSRSSFAARFTELVGEPVMGYVTAWRMDLAARLVEEGDAPLSRVAERVGYRSEAAFNRAFRRAHATTPGAYARRRRSGPTLPVT
ncbi:AraC family transcriptional regulator [Nocardioides sp. SYSU DS0663]|uniref:AraC family transcriptional regulator n=1 Tax=Nocardioides sp. SYSU DS0663 TaxID=3416445 RepID=UPI003F4BF900